MRAYALPVSIALLAAAVALHAILPAKAAPTPAPPAPVEAPAPAPPPPPPPPNCEKFQGKLASGAPLSEIQSWLTQQRNQGRGQFVAVTTDVTYAVLCAY